MSIPSDLTEQRFGRLVAQKRVASNDHGQAQWLCVCDCGNTCVALASLLRKKQGGTKSCGCYRQERGVEHGSQIQLRHGHARNGATSYLYRVWDAMKRRCHNPRHANYVDYGARGITVCARWRESFEAFAEDVGARPSPKHSLDRIENDRGYTPGNVRWATAREQNCNRRGNRLVTLEGETKCVTAWCAHLGISVNTVYGRLKRGVPIEDALRAGSGKQGAHR